MADNNYKMPPEVKEVIKKFVKIDDFDRELTDEELENVSGGVGYFLKDDVCYVNLFGETITMQEYHDMLQVMYNEFGYDITIEFILSIDPDPHHIERLRTGGPDYLVGCVENKLRT